MAKKRSKKSGSKRTITPEQQAKMQAARKAAKVHKDRLNMLYESGVASSEPETKTERMLRSVRRG